MQRTHTKRGLCTETETVIARCGVCRHVGIAPGAPAAGWHRVGGRRRKPARGACAPHQRLVSGSITPRHTHLWNREHRVVVKVTEDGDQDVPWQRSIAGRRRRARRRGAASVAVAPPSRWRRRAIRSITRGPLSTDQGEMCPEQRMGVRWHRGQVALPPLPASETDAGCTARKQHEHQAMAPSNHRHKRNGVLMVQVLGSENGLPQW